MSAASVKKPPADLPPSDSPPKYCGEAGCLEEAYANGKCQKHYLAANKGAAKGRASARTSGPSTVNPVPESSTKKVTRLEVEALIVPAMAMLGVFIDEAYEPATIVEGPNGKEAKIKPHVDGAITQMLPWFEIYGSAFAKAMPWIGLIGGCTTLVMPALEPTIEIVAGVRKPRCLRTDPNDIFTEQYKRARAAHAQKVNEQRDSEAPAARQTVVAMASPIQGEGKTGIA